MPRRKICVVITARASYSRVKSALKAIQDHPDLELEIVIAGSALLNRYGSIIKYVEADGFRIAAKVYNVLEGNNLTTQAKTTGLGIIELSNIFENIKPGGVITIADRYETIATAIAASYMNIPLVHIQGGEVTGNIDEKVRHAVTKLSDVHFVSNQKAAERVVRLGEAPEKVFNTGCPSIDLAKEIQTETELGFDPYEKYGGVGHFPPYSSTYCVVMQHPVTTEYDSSRYNIEQTLYAVKALDLPTFWFWPNVDAGSDGTSNGIRAFREAEDVSKIHFFKNMEPNDFLKFISKSSCLIGNSSVGIRECSFLGIPVVNIGGRQSGRQKGANVIDVAYEKVEILEAVRKQINHGKYPIDALYGEGNAGVKIAHLLATIPFTFSKKLTY